MPRCVRFRHCGATSTKNRNAEKIAAQAGGIFDQFSLILESLDEVGRSLDKAQESYEQVHKRLSTGRGNLVRRVQQLQDLGARTTKTLPTSVLEVEEIGPVIQLTPQKPEPQEI